VESHAARISLLRESSQTQSGDAEIPRLTAAQWARLFDHLVGAAARLLQQLAQQPEPLGPKLDISGR